MPAALDDITVLDLSTMLPGQTCSMILGDLGARVITIERPGLGDYARHRGLPGSFESVNRNKESVTINLKHPDGQAVLMELARRADLVIEGFRPGVAARLGVGYERVARVNPAIIYCSISGYGQSGSHRNLPGHDPNYLAIAGVLSLAGAPDGPPSADVGVSMADLAGAWFAVIAILAAVRARDRHGVGQYIDLALTDASFALVQNRISESLAGGRIGKATVMARPGVGMFAAADGRYLTVGAVEDHFWKALCATVGADDLLTDPGLQTTLDRRGQGERIRTRLAEQFRSRPCQEWISRLREADVPCAPVNDLREAANSDYAQERGIIERIEHPVVKSLGAVRFPARLSATPATTRRRPPLLGEHTADVLGELGYSKQCVAVLESAGVI
jgi:crotonobetainyl-CoA:carnitine CoA-transferase CaiB-like acyl-CoA transferase